MHFFPRIAIIVLVAGHMGGVLAQPGCDLVLRGQVLDEHDRSPLAFAELYLPALERGVVADADGAYRLDGLCAGRFLLRVTHLGCEAIEVEVDLMADKEMDIRLEHHAEELKELEIIRQRPDENVGRSVGSVTSAEMERSTGATLAEMLTSVNGVQMVQSGPTIGKPMVRGLSGNRVLLLNQGIRQEDQQWGNEHAPNLDPYSTDRITVVKGASSVEYGSDAIGGVVITEPVQLPSSGGLSGELRGIGNWNGRGGGMNGSLQGTAPGVSGLAWRVQASGRYLGDAQAPMYVLSNSGLREAAGSATVGWKRQRMGAKVYYSYFNRELGILRASHIGNLTDLENAISSGSPWYTAPFSYEVNAPRQVVQHHLVKAETYFRTNEVDQFVLTYGYQADDRQEYDVRRAGRSAIPALDLFLTSHTVDLAFKHFLGPKWHGKIGVTGLVQENYNVPGTGVRPLLPNYDRSSGGIFLVEHFQLDDDLEVEGGLRLEATRLKVRTFTSDERYITPEHDFTNYAMSVGANWRWTDSLGVRFGLNSAFRPPHVSEMYSEGLHHGAAAIELGDPGLGSERSVQGTVDLHGASADGAWVLDLGLHASSISDYIQLRPDGLRLTIRGAFPVFQYESTDATLWGGDLSLRRHIGPVWSADVRGSVVRGQDRTRDEWLFLMPADRVQLGVRMRPKAKGKWKEPEFGLFLRTVADQSRYPIGLDFSDPPAGYTLLGMSFTVTRQLGRNALSFGFRGENLLNTSYRDYLDRFRYYADARGTDLTLWVRYTFGDSNFTKGP